MGWMWGIAMTVMSTVLISVVTLGTAVFCSRRWDAAFREIAVWEVERRGLDDRKWSSADYRAISRLLGPEPRGPHSSDNPFGGLALPTLSVLCGSSDVRDVASLVVEKREALLGTVLERQLRRVARFSTVRWAARIWVAQKRLSRLEVAMRGAAWLLLRSFDEVANIVKEHSTKLGVAAVFAGALYWRMARNTSQHTDSAPDIVGALTGLAIPGLILWAIGVLLFRILVAIAGPPSGWSRRAAATCASVAALIAGSMLAANFMDKRLTPLTQQLRDRVDPSDPATFRIMAGVFSVGLLWMAHKLAIDSLDRNRLVSDRIGVLAAGGILAAPAVPLVDIAVTGKVSAPFQAAMAASMVLSCLLSTVGLGFVVREWIGRYKILVRAGVRVRRRGFSWWILGTWAAAMTMPFVLAALPTRLQNSILGLALIVPPSLAMLGTFPLIAVCLLFIRRVNAHFERHMTAQRIELGSSAHARSDPARD